VFVQVEFFIAHFEGPQAVGDNYHGDSASEAGHGLHDTIFGFGIKGGCGLIEYQQLRLVVERAGEADSLTLAARESNPPLADDGLPAVGQFILDEVEDLSSGRGAFESGRVEFLWEHSEGDVGSDRIVDEEYFLWDVADAAAPSTMVMKSERDVINEDAARVRDVEAENQIDKGGFATAGGSHNTERRVFWDAE
jgi:hypothetical protein